MANAKFNSFKAALQRGDINLATDDIKVMLVTSAYTPNIDTHAFRSSVTGEVAGTGYTAGGKSLTGKSVTVDNAADVSRFDADDVTWVASTITARGAVLYQNVGTAGTDRLIAYFDFGTDQISSEGDFIIQWNTSGILTLS